MGWDGMLSHLISCHVMSCHVMSCRALFCPPFLSLLVTALTLSLTHAHTTHIHHTYTSMPLSVCVCHITSDISDEGPLAFAEVPFSEYQGGEFSSDDIDDTLFEW